MGATIERVGGERGEAARVKGGECVSVVSLKGEMDLWEE